MKTNETLLSGIGNNIRSLRKARKFSQVEMAKKVGVSISQYRRLEGGEANVSVSILVNIASFLEVSLDLLVHGESISTENDTIELKEPELIEKMKELEALTGEDKKLAHKVLDLLIAKKQLNDIVAHIHK
ncbi:helix-turn-helix domain-containing protein [Pseudotamlana carrageenivorans]|uniref:HTH cro/C1-type domain-containing protein n=1 Tax=Pseudotamlana carrageenivorans TaxID=2069432 RepID=A0A2I7SG82_9FLAO|nr:helix-turn-helix transcriptional regulator [Tamlana carrageenivorans]AUS04916.1 hypothetical protein C1A40_05280 [Tamlana carrageenivorans]